MPVVVAAPDLSLEKLLFFWHMHCTGSHLSSFSLHVKHYDVTRTQL